MTEENPTPAPATPPAPAVAAPAEGKKPVFTRKRAVAGAGAVGLVIALAAAFGLGYWAARPSHHDRPHGWAAVKFYGGDGPDRRFPGPGGGFPGGERRGPKPPARPGAKLPDGLRPAALGTIGQINGDDWSVNTFDGKTVTVRINGQTTFGTAQFPQERLQFAAGDPVVVRGKLDNNTVTATNVVERQGPRR